MALLITNQGAVFVTDVSLNEGVSGAGGGGLTSNTTVNLLTTDSTAEKQAKIDAVPTSAAAGVVTTFQFADGTHTETDTLNFDGFTYPIVIQGNDSDSAALSTAQSVHVDGSGHAEDVISVNGSNYVTVSKLKVTVSDTAQKNALYLRCNYAIAQYCYLLGSAKTTANYSVQFDGALGYAIATYVSNTDKAIRAVRSFIQSVGNDDTATAPNYGLSSVSSTVHKSGTQPSGTTANENTGSGGVIR